MKSTTVQKKNPKTNVTKITGAKKNTKTIIQKWKLAGEHQAVKEEEVKVSTGLLNGQGRAEFEIPKNCSIGGLHHYED